LPASNASAELATVCLLVALAVTRTRVGALILGYRYALGIHYITFFALITKVLDPDEIRKKYSKSSIIHLVYISVRICNNTSC
jgi:hypothetical protein